MFKKNIVLYLVLVFAVLFFAYLFSPGQSTLNKKNLTPEEAKLQQQFSAAVASFNAGDIQSAKEGFSNFLRITGYQEGAYFWLSTIYVTEKNFDQAFDYARPLLENSTNPGLLTDLGSIFAQAGYNKMGYACYAKALKEDQNFVPAYTELGKLYGNEDKFIQAIGVWQDGLRRDPKNRELQQLIQQAHDLWSQSKEESNSN